MGNMTRTLSLSVTFFTLACGSGGTESEPRAPIAAITLGDDLTAIDLCRAIPPENVEAVLGRKLAEPPERFEYDDTGKTSGCTYDGGKDGEGNAHFGYVVLTPAEAFDNQPLYEKLEVEGIGESAYFNNGPDARQLWVKVGDRAAFVVAFGDEPREEGARALARLVVAAIR
jgi:hypothetical protein